MELKKERGTPKICNVVAMLLVGSLPFSDRLKMQSALIQFVRYVDKQQRCLIRVKDGVEREKKTLSTSQSDLMISGEIELSDDIADLFTAINSAEKLRRTFFSVFSFGASGEKVSVIKNMRDTVQHTHDRIENLSVYSVPIVTSFDFSQDEIFCADRGGNILSIKFEEVKEVVLHYDELAVRIMIMGTGTFVWFFRKGCILSV
jgi:hypothetical protein